MLRLGDSGPETSDIRGQRNIRQGKGLFLSATDFSTAHSFECAKGLGFRVSRFWVLRSAEFRISDLGCKEFRVWRPKATAVMAKPVPLED